MNIGQPDGEESDQQIVKDDEILRTRLIIKKLTVRRFKVYISNYDDKSLRANPINLEVSLTFKFNDDMTKYTKGKKYPVITFLDKNDTPETRSVIPTSTSTIGNKYVRCVPNPCYREEGNGFTIVQTMPVSMLTEATGNYNYEIDIAMPDVGLLIPAISEGEDSTDFITIASATVHMAGLETSSSGNLRYTRSIGPLLNTESTGPINPQFRFDKPVIDSIIKKSSFAPEYCVGGRNHYLFTTNDFYDYLNKILVEDPLPVMSYSLSHNNHSGEENGIRYYSTRPSSEVSEEFNIKMKTSQRILRFLNKLIGRKGKRNE